MRLWGKQKDERGAATGMGKLPVLDAQRAAAQHVQKGPVGLRLEMAAAAQGAGVEQRGPHMEAFQQGGQAVQGLRRLGSGHSGR